MIDDLGPLRIILGSARSGTTWLQDVLARANGLRTIFEPLHPQGDARAAAFAHRYLRSEDHPAGFDEFLADVLAGKGMRLWSDLRVNPAHVFRWQSPVGYAAQALYVARGLRRYLPARGRPLLVKFIRANLMSEWLVSHLAASTLLIVRHPCAVVGSQLGLDPAAWHDFRELLDFHLADERLVEEHLGGLEGQLRGLNHPVEIRAALWCIENTIPMRRAGEEGVGVVFYEHLLTGRAEAWSTALETLDLTEMPSEAVLQAPSQQASPELKKRAKDEASVGRWSERFDPSDLILVQGLLDLFEVEEYSVADPMPSVGPS